ncbi:MAG: HD domain-containing protein [Lewinellaceae bacterium]|nr:HD domain-containing protein [Saprospiraceae bacterium]MCB9340270.1 HD domain-containing protein [Lewinellaceae bacterium]
MKTQIVKNANDYVIDLLSKGLTPDHRYHDLAHTRSVRDAAQDLGKRYQLEDQELELLELAALFHDTGFTKTYNGHEEVSKKIAEAFLAQENYPPERIAEVKDLIEMTKVGVEPKTLIQKVMKDADFNTNGSTYLEKSDALRHEWEVFSNINMTDKEWLKNNLAFWGQHQFYTGEAQALYGKEKRKTLKKTKKRLEKLEEDKYAPQPLAVEDLGFSISKSKSAQMMFKTTLRNQIDLTNIADNKANIMLSINSLLITIGIPILASNLEKSPNLIYPAGVLLLTCILSIVYATTATRPVKMEGFTDLDKIKEGKTNLFFFGNFYKMNREDYLRGLTTVTNDESTLDHSIVNDLYFLGRTLGNKYRRLRITYGIFMIGMVATVLVFLATILFGGKG